MNKNFYELYAKGYYTGGTYTSPYKPYYIGASSCCRLFNIKTQTTSICLAELKVFGLALNYVQNQTLDLCLAAYNSATFSLRYIRDDQMFCDTVNHIRRFNGPYDELEDPTFLDKVTHLRNLNDGWKY